jgi:TP53 regulating kinase-like protein
MQTKIAQGAEAILYSDGSTVVKDRFEKRYRHPELDRRLRKSRTRREGKILEKLSLAMFPAPQLVEIDDSAMKVSMSHIPGDMVKVVVDGLESKGDEARYLELFAEIGEGVAELHNNGIVHHDLTTSNMIMHSSDGKVYLIDFGLSFFSDKVEDYAVDLHLLRHALESRHHRIWEKCFAAVTSAYAKKMLQGETVLARLEKVEKRGRYKSKH